MPDRCQMRTHLLPHLPRTTPTTAWSLTIKSASASGLALSPPKVEATSLRNARSQGKLPQYPVCTGRDGWNKYAGECAISTPPKDRPSSAGADGAETYPNTAVRPQICASSTFGIEGTGGCPQVFMRLRSVYKRKNAQSRKFPEQAVSDRGEEACMLNVRRSRSFSCERTQRGRSRFRHKYTKPQVSAGARCLACRRATQPI